MKIKNLYIIIFLLLTINIFLVFRCFLSDNYLENNKIISIDLETETWCKIEESIKIVDWDSMYPLISNWSEIKFFNYHYKCSKIFPKNWDIVAYKYSWNINNLIKQVKVTDEDIVEISWNNLKINWELMKNSDWQEYIFSDGEIMMISLYINEWKIPKDSYLIFWDNINDSIDSRKFWAVSSNDILWKFEIIKK